MIEAKNNKTTGMKIAIRNSLWSVRISTQDPSPLQSHSPQPTMSILACCDASASTAHFFVVNHSNQPKNTHPIFEENSLQRFYTPSLCLLQEQQMQKAAGEFGNNRIRRASKNITKRYFSRVDDRVKNPGSMCLGRASQKSHAACNSNLSNFALDSVRKHH